MGEFKPKPSCPIKKDWRVNLKISTKKKLDVGDTFYTFDGYKNHIIGFVDDGEEKVMVYKCWLKYKGYWGYYCKWMPSIIHEICLLYDIPKNKRKEFFEVNGVNSEGWI